MEKKFNLGGFLEIYLSGRYLVDPTVDVAPVNAGQTNLGPRVNHLRKIWDLDVQFQRIGTKLKARKKNRDRQCGLLKNKSEERYLGHVPWAFVGLSGYHFVEQCS